MNLGCELHCHDNDSFMLGEESIRETDPELRKITRWRIGKGGELHPAICPTCGRVLDRDLWERKFRLRKKKLDFSTTYDGYTVVSDRVKVFFEQREVQGLRLVPLPSAKGRYWLDEYGVTQLEVDSEASGIRFGERCPQCNEHYEVLRGLIPGTPPSVMPLRFRGDIAAFPESLYRTDLCFGSTHGLSPGIVLGEETARALRAEAFSGVILKEFKPYKCG